MTSRNPGPAVARGRCLCGAVAFEARGPLRPVVACHCSQCRRTHGHYAAYSRVAVKDLEMTRNEGLRWYRSSETAERGFCFHCGASLFWRPRDSDHVSLAAGALDPPTGLRLAGHIFCASQGDYYRIDDDLPKYQGSAAGAFDSATGPAPSRSQPPR